MTSRVTTPRETSAPLPRRSLLVTTAAFSLAAIGAARAQTTAEPTGPQPTLSTEELVIVSAGEVRHVFHVEIASTPREQVVGLMFRKSVAADGGMLFPWSRPIESRMWMENTLVPLDMVFIKADGTIGWIVENTVPQSLAVISSGGPVAATLELQGGITSKLNILVGDHVLCKALGTTP